MSKKISPAHTWQQSFYGYFALARISNSPTIISNTLAGAALAGVLRPGGKLGFIAIAMVLFYSAGMYLNDLLDYAIDCRERPERPLPAGLVSRSAATTVVLALFGTGSILLWYAGPLSFLSGFVLIALIICYDRWHKNNPLSPLLMALCRLMVYVTAFLAISRQPLPALLIPAGLLVLYVMGLTSIAKTENKPSMTNARIVATLFLPAVYFTARQLQQPQWSTLLLILFFTVWVAYSISFAFRSPKRQIGRTAGQLIAGISLVDGLVLTLSGSLFGMVLALVAFGSTLYLQRYVRGT